MPEFELGVLFDQQRLFRDEFSVRKPREKIQKLIHDMQIAMDTVGCVGLRINMQNFSLTVEPAIDPASIPAEF